MKNNKEKAITIAALVIAVIGLSIGFAAFASTLNISTSASVTPADGNFIVKFSKVNNELNEEDVTPSTGTGDAADIDNTNASNPKIGTLSTTFTQPGQSVEYTFYVRNMGKYDAYLTNIRFNNASTGNSFKVCTATSDNPVSNANDMCQYITYRLTLEDSPSNKVLTSTSDFATTVGNSYYVAKSADPTTGTTNSKMVKVTITYEDGSPFADGAFTVNFGSVELVFASLAGYVPQTQTSSSNILVGKTFSAEMNHGNSYSSFVMAKNIKADTLEFYNDTFRDYVEIPYTYDSSTHILSVANGTYEMNVVELDNNILIYNDDLDAVAVTNSNVGTVLITGYTYSSGALYTFSLVDGHGLVGKEMDTQLIYYLIDDTNTSSGDALLIIDGDVYTITKENGVYTSFTDGTNTYTLTAPTP